MKNIFNIKTFGGGREYIGSTAVVWVHPDLSLIKIEGLSILNFSNYN